MLKDPTLMQALASAPKPGAEEDAGDGEKTE